MQFSPDLRERVASGLVTMTVRLWQRPQVRVGGRYDVSGSTIEVTSIELVPFCALTGADIQRCGEPGREALRVRAAHAGPIEDNTPVFRIEFQVVPRGDG